MSREIKFRAWDKENEKMMKVSSLSLENKEIAVRENGTYHFFRMQNLELMQYTGLKDKNDKEIYEGDVVVLNNIKIDNMCIVRYEHNSYRLEGWSLREDLSNVEAKFLEVVGNIYESKNLLEENN
ncbi:YopX family protein [Leptotrichia sp. oral taxon 847]|uniref:YopX family protein n=1 Tax=Leptotrichia sp. oral taxon 847 TaxID=1785996 RepID=UPI000767E78D|nr:YopX family protein [Leptotrichia sp. oral taxon 847]AMD94545.1 hypothetical protein AXF11_02325 [Leptotrichia sp. oral taxon 847]